ncbi:MAG: ATP-binding protein [Gammaproteobacteria bacterium]|nr:ATP-binding protein [Gammaproteobacteria bacterium]
MNTASQNILNHIHSSSGWHRLRLFNYYRGTLALFFITIYLNDWIDLFASHKDFQPILFLSASIFYFCSFFAFILGIQRQKPSIKTQTIIQTCIDIIVIVTITHAFGGIKSGLGMLLIINISLSGLFLPKRLTLLFAAATTLTILTDQIYSQLITPDFQASFMQAGILGMLIFTFAFMASNFSKQLRDTEQLADEQGRELETATQLSEHIIHSMRTGIIVLSPNGNILMSNNAAENLLGNIKLPANTSLKNIAPDLFQRFVEWQLNFEHAQQTPIQQSHGLPDIQPGFSAIEKDKRTQGQTLVFLEDASQLNQRFQQVKLASVGRLTASIAHEIRNPLAAIQHASQLLEESSENPDDLKLARIITTHTQRINDVVKNVLQLSRKQYYNPEVVNLKNWLVQFKNEFCPSNGINENQIDINIQPESISVLFDPEQLYQVFWNLCSNAINHSGIDTQQLSIKLHGQLSDEAEQVYIDIIDNGLGINEDIAAHIFEPFYTTSTQGTGLGLYIIKEIVENNRAKIKQIEQTHNGGCFRIYFMKTDSKNSTGLKDSDTMDIQV